MKGTKSQPIINIFEGLPGNVTHATILIFGISQRSTEHGMTNFLKEV